MNENQMLLLAGNKLQHGQVEEAEKLLDEVIKDYPDNADAHQMRGIISAQKSEYAKADIFLSRAISLNSSDFSSHINRGLVMQKTGRLTEALDEYNQAININPDASTAYCYMAFVLSTLGSLDNALGACNQAIRINPEYAEAYNLQGTILKKKGNHAGALSAYSSAICLNQGYAEAFSNQGSLLWCMGRLEEAWQSCEQAIKLQPSNAEAYNNLGNVLESMGRQDEALRAYTQATQVQPDLYRAHSNRSEVLRKLGQLENALNASDHALRLNPEHAEAYNKRGNILMDMKLVEEALESYTRAIKIKPGFEKAYINKASALIGMNRLGEALECCENAQELISDSAEIYYLLGNTMKYMGRLEVAMAAYSHAIDISPDYAKAHNSRGLLMLLMGDFEHGWAEVEWRPQIQSGKALHPGWPRWQGGNLEGKCILIHAEQGIGDEIMYASCFPDVIKLAGRTIIHCDPRLESLFSRSFPEAEIIGSPDTCGDWLDTLGDVDVQELAGSLPLRLQRNMHDHRNICPYLVPDQGKKRTWEKRLLTQEQRFNVGISWRGGKTPYTQQSRSISIIELASALSTPGVHLINLQYGNCIKEIEDVWGKTGVEITSYDNIDPLVEQDNFAALISSLDLVISADNSTVHLAAALGIPVWVLLPHPPDWRWLLDRDDSPWYPTIKLIRCTSDNGWSHVCQKVKEELTELLSCHHGLK